MHPVRRAIAVACLLIAQTPLGAQQAPPGLDPRFEVIAAVGPDGHESVVQFPVFGR